MTRAAEADCRRTSGAAGGGGAAFSLQRRVRWGECDPAGVMYTPRFADFAVDAFLDFLSQLLGAPLERQLRELDCSTPALSLALEFERTLWPGDLVTLSVAVAAVRTRSFDIVVQATAEDGKPAFRAKLGLVCVYHAKRKSRPIPATLRHRLNEYLLAAPAAT